MLGAFPHEMGNMAKQHEVVPMDRSYSVLLSEVARLLARARRASARSVNAVMTATYWDIGRRILEHEQKGKARAVYGEALIDRLAADLTARLGKGFSPTNLKQMREFFLAWPIRQTLSDDSHPATASPAEPLKSQTLSDPLQAPVFPLPWSHYVRLLSVRDLEARAFYEKEALSGGWSVRQLDRQISSQFYERMALSRKKGALLKKGRLALDADQVTPEEEIKDPMVLEFPASRTSTPRAPWRKPSSGAWKTSCLNSETSLPSLAASAGSASETTGTVLTCSSITAGFAV